MIKRLFAVLYLMVATFAVQADEPASQALDTLFKEERAWFYKLNPDSAPASERDGPVLDFPDQSEAAFKAAHLKYQEWIDRIQKIDRSALSANEQVNYDLFLYIQQQKLLDYQFKTFRNPLYSDSGFHTWVQRYYQRLRFATVEDYENYLTRLSAIPTYFAAIEENLAVGLAEGFTMPQAVLKGLMPTFSYPIVDAVEDSVFYRPFKTMPATLSAEEQETLRVKATKVIMQDVIGAYRRLNSFMVDKYYPGARKELAARSMPRGEDYYRSVVKYYTTLDMTPDQVHEIGLKEVARIRSEMEEILKQVKFDGSFAEFLQFLRTDKQFYATSAKELIMVASYIAKKIDGRLPKLFKHLPRQPYGVEAVPDAIAPNYTTGRYISAGKDSPRGGYYWVNTYNLQQRPLYNLPALTLHEGMPGHHLQIALSREITGLPAFRRGYYPVAFGEGWGLYSEKLGLEMDIYETPYDHFGRLSYEMWRAARLVVDTGVHWKGWTREQAIQLMEENSALSKHNIRTEVDRYIAWPGQALGYKIGELKILELRQRAESALGETFDVREFHHQVVSEGGMPLTMLENKIDRWIAETQKANAEKSVASQPK